MNIDQIIKYIETRKQERVAELHGLEMADFETVGEKNKFLGVEMVIRWLNDYNTR